MDQKDLPKWGSLREKKCVPCEGGMPPLDHDAIERLQPEIDLAWNIIDGKKIRREFKFADFKQAVDFVDKVAALAESEKHHPTIEVDYDNVALELWTHAIGGLSENDFILAAKIDALQ
ncbi:4a-hydroxytetrahydrobiopterin dehydratase [Candidatus Parcubacteria bacterium]|nr:MAG: 4a-hydroxytetrahydrobiopterin dehydratase [Candidatus Parcubacteria bacterium]